MIIRSRGGDASIESRAAVQPFGSNAILPWGFANGGPTHSGNVVSMDSAESLPAFLSAIKIVAGVTAALPLLVYKGETIDRAPAFDSWQHDLLRNHPGPELTSYNFVSDLVAGVEGYGNAFAQKFKSRVRGATQVVEMQVIPPDYVRVRRDEQGNKLFDVHVDGRTRKGLTSADILHVRGFTMDGCYSGMSVVQTHRHSLGQMLAAEEYVGRFYANDATPSGYIKVPGHLRKNDAITMLRTFERQHQGLRAAGRPALLYDNADFVHLGMSMQDAQYIEGRRFSVEDIARICRVPVELLQSSTSRPITTEEIMLRFSMVDLNPRLRRIEDALRADADLFAGTGLFPVFDTSQLLRTDMASQFDAYTKARQGGYMTANEIRARLGLPPIDGGDVLQATPVGGAPGDVPNTPDAPAIVEAA